MKRGVAITVVFACLFLWAFPSVAAPKPPKRFCCLVGFSGLWLSVTPSGEKVPRPLSGQDRFYAIHGRFGGFSSQGTATGTGYMEGDEFHFGLHVTIPADPAAVSWTYACIYDVVTETGTCDILTVDGSGGIDQFLGQDILASDCGP